MVNKCADCGHGTLREKCIRCEWRETQAWLNASRIVNKDFEESEEGWQDTSAQS